MENLGFRERENVLQDQGPPNGKRRWPAVKLCTMTIHDFAQKLRMQKINIRFSAVPSAAENFPPQETDVLVSCDGETFLGINRVSGKFAAHRRHACVEGHASSPLTREQLETLQVC